MRNRLVVAWIILSCACVVILANHANAHVLIANERDSIGAVLHITPDDDPIAGKSTHIFYDIQNKSFDAGKYEAVLTVRDTATGQESDVQMDIKGSYVSGEYTFKTQGVYQLVLEVGHGTQAERFIVTQRVSRGTPEATSSRTVRHQWAEMLTVFSSTGLAALVILATARGRRILSQSR